MLLGVAGRTLSSHSSAFKPAAGQGTRSGGAFSAVGTGKMSLNNMLSGSAAVHAPATTGDGVGGGSSESAPSVATHDDASAIAGATETQHEILEEQKIRRRKEKKKKKRKREKKERRREEKRLKKEAAIARTAAYTESAEGHGAEAGPVSALDDATSVTGGPEASPSSTDDNQSSPDADGKVAKEDERDDKEEQDDDTDDDTDDDDKDEDEQKASRDTSHLVQSKNARGRPQRSAAVAAEAISAASNATTDREARREERERRDRLASSLDPTASASRCLSSCLSVSYSTNMSGSTHREKAKAPLVDRKPDAKSLRLAAKGLYFSPGQVSSSLGVI